MELLTGAGFGLNRPKLAAGGAKSFLILNGLRFLPLGLFTHTHTKYINVLMCVYRPVEVRGQHEGITSFLSGSRDGTQAVGTWGKHLYLM